MKACEKATYLKEKSNLTKLSFGEWFLMKFHFFLCPPCKKYGHDSDHLNEALKKCQSEKKYPEPKKAELKEKLH